MKSASVAEIRRELKQISATELQKITELLAKYSNDNKAYLSYLLYEAHDKAEYVQSVKKEIDAELAVFNAGSNLYFSKKTLRKILRQINKYAKYTGDKTVLAGLLIYFCKQLNATQFPYHKSQVLLNLYNRTVFNAARAVSSLHEDLQADYMTDVMALTYDENAGA